MDTSRDPKDIHLARLSDRTGRATNICIYQVAALGYEYYIRHHESPHHRPPPPTRDDHAPRNEHLYTQAPNTGK